jgi:peroxiredoxin Q/BCP
MLRIIIANLLFISVLFGGEVLKVGTKAPDFELPDAEGKIHKLSDYEGKKIVLYFYPKNNTPGCTAEACNLRDNYDTLIEKDIVILGVSFDDQDSHKNFSEEHNLPFTLLSDSEKKVADMYGAKRGILGFIGAKRITYLIDEEGLVMHVFESVDTGSHAEQILKVIGEKESHKKS